MKNLISSSLMFIATLGLLQLILLFDVLSCQHEFFTALADLIVLKIDLDWNNFRAINVHFMTHCLLLIFQLPRLDVCCSSILVFKVLTCIPSLHLMLSGII